MEQQERMFVLVETYHQSGQSQKDFCKEHHIKASTFSYWIKKKRMGENPQAAFLKINTRASSADTVEIIYPNGVRLKINQDDMTAIGALIRLY